MSANLFHQKNSKKKRLIGEINITPLVDVLLVLLIIFMVTAPMMTSGINVDLPKGATDAIDAKKESISVSVQKDGSIFVEEKLVKLDDLPKKLLLITEKQTDKKIYVRADKLLDYGKVMEVVRSINLGGFTQVVLVTEFTQ